MRSGASTGLGFLIFGGTLAGLLLFRFYLRLFRLQRPLSRFYVAVQRLGFSHQFQNSILRLADLRLAEIDLILKGAILVVGFGLQSLIFELGDFLVLGLNIGVAFLALFLIGGQGGTVSFQLTLMRNQLFFDFSDVHGERGDLAVQIR